MLCFNAVALPQGRVEGAWHSPRYKNGRKGAAATSENPQPPTAAKRSPYRRGPALGLTVDESGTFGTAHSLCGFDEYCATHHPQE